MVTYEFNPKDSTASLVYGVIAKENDEVIAEFSICVNSDDEREAVAADGLHQIQNPAQNY